MLARDVEKKKVHVALIAKTQQSQEECKKLRTRATPGLVPIHTGGQKIYSGVGIQNTCRRSIRDVPKNVSFYGLYGKVAHL